MSMTVLVNAGPWLPVAPVGYGGLENVVGTLVDGLRQRGVRVVLATVEESRQPADERLAVMSHGQFPHLQRPYNQVSGIAAAHLHAVVRLLRERDDIDLVHDHVEAIGPAVLSAMGVCGPPVLHTLHWDLTKHPELYGHFDGGGRVWVNGVSADQLRHAPAALRAHALGHVHLATPLAGRPRRVVPRSERRPDLVVLGRITPCKGTHLAARLAHRLRLPVVLAGPVGPYRDAAALAAAGQAALQNPDVRYWHEQVAAHVDGDLVRWIGTVADGDRDELVAGARAVLCPVQWAEPGGTAIVESLALGTPVAGFGRGCLPELLDHGRTGLLADDEEELAELLPAVGDLDPHECRREATRRFTPAAMADGYLRLYEETLRRGQLPAPPALTQQPGPPVRPLSRLSAPPPLTSH